MPRPLLLSKKILYEVTYTPKNAAFEDTKVLAVADFQALTQQMQYQFAAVKFAAREITEVLA